jgi:hypothetical protein
MEDRERTNRERLITESREKCDLAREAVAHAHAAIARSKAILRDRLASHRARIEASSNSDR